MHDAEVVGQGRYVEAGEMEDLEHRRIGEQRLEVRCGPVLAVELHEMGGAVAGRQLHHAQPVALRVKPHASRCLWPRCCRRRGRRAGRSCAA